MYQVYLVTNRVNGKVYVGQTSKGIDTRWRGHQRAAKYLKKEDCYFYRALRKYGPDGFDVQQLAATDDSDAANELEKLWIICLRASESQFGYNGTIGGDGRYCPNEETLRKRRETFKKNYRRENNKQFRTDISDEEVKRLYCEENKSCREIAKVVGCSWATAKTRLKACGVKLRPVGNVGNFYKYSHNAERRKKISDNNKTNPAAIAHMRNLTPPREPIKPWGRPKCN